MRIQKRKHASDSNDIRRLANDNVGESFSALRLGFSKPKTWAIATELQYFCTKKKQRASLQLNDVSLSPLLSTSLCLVCGSYMPWYVTSLATRTTGCSRTALRVLGVASVLLTPGEMASLFGCASCRCSILLCSLVEVTLLCAKSLDPWCSCQSYILIAFSTMPPAGFDKCRRRYDQSSLH